MAGIDWQLAHPVDLIDNSHQTVVSTWPHYRSSVCGHCEQPLDCTKSFVITSQDGRHQFCSCDCAEAHAVVEDTKQALDPNAPSPDLQEFIEQLRTMPMPSLVTAPAPIDLEAGPTWTSSMPMIQLSSISKGW